MSALRTQYHAAYLQLRPGSNQPFPDPTPVQERFNLAWEHVINVFAGTAGIVGYDPLKEPTSRTPRAFTCLVPFVGCPILDATVIAPFYTNFVNAIRRFDPTTMILYEPNVYSAGGFPSAVSTGDDANLALSFHYDPQVPIIPNEAGNIARTELTAALSGEGIIL